MRSLRNVRSVIAVPCFCWCLACGLTCAQEPAPPAAKNAPDAPLLKELAEWVLKKAGSKPSAVPDVVSDPTIPSPEMKAVLDQQRLLQTPIGAAKLPVLQIKGRVVSPDGEVLVLLQIGQQVARLTTDAEWTTEEGLTVKTVSVSPSEVRIQIQPFNRTVTLR